MIEQGTSGAIINTGSKQGITTPPGDTAYNLAKAGVKVLTEAVAHQLRNIDGMSKGDFYILCPDNAVTREMDEKRIRWAADDLIQNRPALSRWHPDFTDVFDRFMKE
jgi:NAD(P)-dependent dehydrogenase (short-subunit alcohol dehydrogenase family)